MRTFGGGGGAAPKQKQKPKAKGKSSGNQLGTALADMLKNVGTTVQRASNEATARKMPAVAKQRGFHVVGDQAYFSNAKGQVEPVFGSKLQDLLAASKPTGGKYGAKIFAGNVRVGGAQKLGLLQDALDRMNAINDAYRAQQEKLVVRGPGGRPVMPQVFDPKNFTFGIHQPSPAYGTPEYDAYKSALADFLLQQQKDNQRPDKAAIWWNKFKKDFYGPSGLDRNTPKPGQVYYGGGY